MRSGCTYLFLIFALNSAAQNYADKAYYLVDSLDLTTVSKTEKDLIDSCLELYHTKSTSLDKIAEINILVEQSFDDNIWPKYNQWIYQFCQKELGKNPSKKMGIRLKEYLAGAINNFGYLEQHLGDTDKALEHYKESLDLYSELENLEGIGNSLNNLGALYFSIGDTELGLKKYKESLEIRRKENDEYGIANSLNNIGYVHFSRGEIPQALEKYNESLKIREKLENNELIVPVLNNIALCYEELQDYELALENYQKCYDIDKSEDYPIGMAYSLSNIGHIHQLLKDAPQALTYYKRGLVLFREQKHDNGQASLLNSIAHLYLEEGEVAIALENSIQSKKIFERIGDKEGLCSSYEGLAKAFLLLDQLDSASWYADKSLFLAIELGYPANISISSKTASDVAEKRNDWQQALKNYRLHISMEDSLHSIKATKAIVLQQTRSEFEKNQAIRDARHEKNLELLEEKERNQRFITYAIAGGLILVISFLLFVFNQLKVTKKQNRIIEDKNKETESAHLLLKEKNKLVMASIRYAKKIQVAMLKWDDNVSKERMPDHFIFYLPKDIISGDFYWVQEKGDYLYMAAADCTGHGVPGAMLTMLGTSFLNEINYMDVPLKPSDILNQLREKIIANLAHTKEIGSSRDGMDISLIRLDRKTRELQWSGANNPLYLVADEESQREVLRKDPRHITLNERSIFGLKANSQAVGLDYNEAPFDNHQIQLSKGDCIYLFTDGFSDQFGEKTGKKYMSFRFKKKLLELSTFGMEQQKELLQEEFYSWKGNQEQIDDVCVIGLKI